MTILPCPFCNSCDVALQTSWMLDFVTCRVCGTIGPKAECDETRAVALWNRRYIVEPISDWEKQP